MIVLYHNDNSVVTIWHRSKREEVVVKSRSISKAFFEVASLYPDALIIWCHESQKDHLNLDGIPAIFHHQKIMASYVPGEGCYFPTAIGYVEESPFIRVNKGVSYPTWQMSSCVGGVSAEIVNLMVAEKYEDFDYVLNSIAKRGMALGLFCYSEPTLLHKDAAAIVTLRQASVYRLFQFVKQHYKTRWALLLFLNLMFYKRKLPLLPLFFSLFYKNLKKWPLSLDGIPVRSSKKMIQDPTVDVVIPTIGRKAYLYDVLCDLRQQTMLPTKVIIVEQNLLPKSTSELDYLQDEEWPFAIDHVFTHQAGACNARNIALTRVESNWVFWADDDIRLASDFFQQAFDGILSFAADAVTFNCYRKGDRQNHTKVFQWPTFGSGCSMVRREALKEKQFNMKYEFGFGEDADFGMQLRNSGTDVLYFPQPSILHLKAPIGGFRTKIIVPWEHEILQPKPSPTVMLYKLEHLTKEQLEGYKTMLCFKFYRNQPIKNPVSYYKNFQRRWKRSLFWATR